jgi:hypothetical protein
VAHAARVVASSQANCVLERDAGEIVEAAGKFSSIAQSINWRTVMSIRPIVDTLRELRHGAMLDEASEQMAEVVKRVAETGKAGALLIKLTVKPAGRGAVRTVVIEDDVGTKLPEPDKEVTVFFPTSDGNLSRQDPAQMNLGLRAVEPAFDAETGEVHHA